MTKKAESEALRALWYKKLQAEGFEDIEQDEDNLKSWSSQFTRTRSRLSQEARQDYYVLADKFLNEYKFENKVHKAIWEYHCAGVSIRNIVRAMKDNDVVCADKSTFGRLIKDLRDTMKKMYMSEERRGA